MVWVFDATSAYDDDRIVVRPSKFVGGDSLLQWKHRRKTIDCCQRPVYLDLGDKLARVKVGSLKYSNWYKCKIGDYAQFIEWANGAS